MKFIVRKTIDCNESEMNENGPQGCLQFKRLKARLLLSIQSVEISRLLPEKKAIYAWTERSQKKF